MNVCIAGAGFAGLKLARCLTGKSGIRVVLVDRINHHQFQPLLYQVATAGLDASNISFPLRKVFHRSPNVRIRIASVQSIDEEKKTLETDTGTIAWDILVLAMGADTNFFGSARLRRFTFPMKSTVEALRLRHRLIALFEATTTEARPEVRSRNMTIVVVGGGPTGVELSGTLAEMKRQVLPLDYPELDFSEFRILLLEGSDRTLAAMSQESSRQSRQYLEGLGVEVRTSTLVKDYDGAEVELVTGEKIASSTVIWAAGIRGNVPGGIDPGLVARGNRIRVDRLNRAEGSDSVFVIGDLAYMETPLYPQGHPQVANVAIHQAANLARNLMDKAAGKSMSAQFEYHDKGSMATVGRHLAVVDIPRPRIHFGGLLAWLIWMGLHLVLILGVKNRIQVLINWVYHYFTWDQSLRLWFRDVDRPEDGPAAS